MKPPSPSLIPYRPLPPPTLRPPLPLPPRRHATTTTPSIAHPKDRPLSLYEPTATRDRQFALANSISAASRPSPHALRSALEDVAQRQANHELERMMTRRWKVGDVYAPHDLGSVEMGKWKGRGGGRRMGKAIGGGRGREWGDVVDVLGVRPVVEYKNFSMIEEFCTKMGRIRHSRETGLRNVNQRKMAKAIRRAVGMGLMPSVHKHPEVLEREAQAKANGAARGGYEGRRG